MSFPKYEAYKDSGVEWLGEVPEHWDSKRLKFIFNLVKRDVGSADRIVTCFRDGVVTLRENRRTEGFTNALKEIGYQGIRVGDLIIHAMDAFAGAIGVSDSDGKSSPVYSVCVPASKSVSADYYARLLRYMALSGFVTSLAKGIRERSTDFRWSDAGEIFLPVPSSEEQTQISCFLDHETARIDALIAEQQRLIELLKEKRQAVISHAVTKGLDPNAPMKDSGVEWLGEVPAHWEVGKFKWFLRTASGGTPPSSDRNTYYDGNIPWLRSLDLNDDLVMNFEVSVTQKAIDETSCKMVPRNSVLIAMYGGDGTIGKNGLLMFDSAINQALCAFLPSPNFEPEYLHRYIQFYRPHWMINAESSRKDPNIGQDRIGDQYVLNPPIQEQREIAEFLDDELSKFDDLSAEANLLVEQLQERRSALISAAVTGKIDVRGWQAPASASPAPTLEPVHG